MDAKIKKKIKANEGGTMWRDRKASFLVCIVQKHIMTSKDVWEKNYANFEACDGMPAKWTKEYNVRQKQLSSGPFGLDGKVKKEIEVIEGGTMWRDRKASLASCIATKIKISA